MANLTVKHMTNLIASDLHAQKRDNSLCPNITGMNFWYEGKIKESRRM